MNKKTLILIFIGVIISAGAVFFFVQNGNKPPDKLPEGNGITLFYGEGCGHCADVEDFIDQNKIEEKISFVRKEVFNNATNAEELIKIAQQCGLFSSSIGVPFLWDGSQCYMGTPDITNFLTQKSGLQ